MKKWYDFTEGIDSRNFGETLKKMYEYSPEFASVDLLALRMEATPGMGTHNHILTLRVRELPLPSSRQWQRYVANVVAIDFQVFLFGVENLEYGNLPAKNFEATSIEVEELSNGYLYWRQYDKDRNLVLSFRVKNKLRARILELISHQSATDIVALNKITPIPISFPFYMEHIVFTYLFIGPKESSYIKTLINIDSYDPIEALTNPKISANAFTYCFQLYGISIKTMNILQNNFIDCSFEIKFIPSNGSYEIICKHCSNEIIFMAEATNVTLNEIDAYTFHINSL